MAQKLVTLCDPDSAQEEHEGRTYRMVLQVLEDGRWVDLVPPGELTDMCDEQRKDQLDKAIDTWNLYHRPEDGTAKPAKRRSPSQTPGAFPCESPSCDAVYQWKSSLRHHMKTVHGYMVARRQAEGNETAPTVREIQVEAPPKSDRRREKRECPECGKVCGSPQGLGQHRSKVHGVPGSSASTLANRARQELTA